MKKFISCVAFVLLVLFLMNVASDILIPKTMNRYYVLEKYLEEHPEDYLHDVQVFGSCHAYTSFNPVYLEEVSGVSAFVYANAGEIIPSTYARMTAQFKKHTPKVALVEIWGINPYETYCDQEDVFGGYLLNNLERAEFSWAKQEVIWEFREKDYEDISLLSVNFPVINYKERVLDSSLKDLDYKYSFADLEEEMSEDLYGEMTTRMNHNGYKVTTVDPIVDYPEKQNTIQPGEMVEIEPDIAKYVQKIINLCKKKGVELIFYRSPYVSTVNELKKVNHLRQICDANNVLFLDLEAEIQYDYKTDFEDYEHLSEIGANKSTEFMLPYIMNALGQTLERKEIVRTNLLVNSDFLHQESDEFGENWFRRESFTATEQGAYACAGDIERNWLLFQDFSDAHTLWGESVTAYFSIVACAGENITPIISFRNENNVEIDSAVIEITNGECTAVGAVPAGTEVIRVGFFAGEGSKAEDFFVVEKIELYQGAFSVDTLPTVAQ